MMGENANSAVPAASGSRSYRNSPSTSAAAMPCKIKAASSYSPNHWNCAGSTGASSLNSTDTHGSESVKEMFTPVPAG